jgi:translocator assembly and maintenance protein 41
MDKLQKVLSQFKAPIRYAFAYGSNVFPQANSTPSNQIDLIFAVTHPQHWHSLNLRQHPSHYSMLRLGGSPIVDMIQRKGAGVYFNPYVTINDMVIHIQILLN